jgi:DNA-binding MarR family transcriptional regulator
MDVVLFSLKRAFRKSIEAGLVLTTPFGLTPARFDLMHVLHRSAGDSIRQFVLKGILGVSAATVSRMVTSLEGLGLVERRQDARGRLCGIALTDEGRALIRRAVHALLDRGAARRMVRACWRRDPVNPRNAKAVLRDQQKGIEELVESLGHVRRAFFDFAWDIYPIVQPKSKAQRAMLESAEVGR